MNKYYDGTKLLSLKDINNELPEIYISTSNRTAGKTTYFNRKLVNGFKKHGHKFMLLYRYAYELDNCSSKFFNEIKRLFFKQDTFVSVPLAKGIYHSLFLNEQHCGYAIDLNHADAIKRMSHLFADTSCMLFDDFQAEDNRYTKGEVRKFISIHTSVARGGGEQYRYVPVYMISNNVSLLNPYYTALGISSRLSIDVNFLRGDGFVVEQGFNESASVAQKSAAFNRAFKSDAYTVYSAEKVYLNDNYAFIEKPSGTSRYIATIRYKNHDYGILEYHDSGIIYCSDVADKTCPQKIALTVDEHNVNYVMIQKNSMFISQMRWYFEHGAFRFKDLKCKECIITMLSY